MTVKKIYIVILLTVSLQVIQCGHKHKHKHYSRTAPDDDYYTTFNHYHHHQHHHRTGNSQRSLPRTKPQIEWEDFSKFWSAWQALRDTPSMTSTRSRRTRSIRSTRSRLTRSDRPTYSESTRLFITCSEPTRSVSLTRSEPTRSLRITSSEPMRSIRSTRSDISTYSESTASLISTSSEPTRSFIFSRSRSTWSPLSTSSEQKRSLRSGPTRSLTSTSSEPIQLITIRLIPTRLIRSTLRSEPTRAIRSTLSSVGRLVRTRSRPTRSHFNSIKYKPSRKPLMRTPRHQLIKCNSTKIGDNVYTIKLLVTLRGLPHYWSNGCEVGNYFFKNGWSDSVQDMLNKHQVWSTYLPENIPAPNFFFKSTTPIDSYTYLIIYSKSVKKMSRKLRGGGQTHWSVSHVYRDVYAMRTMFPVTITAEATAVTEKLIGRGNTQDKIDMSMNEIDVEIPTGATTIEVEATGNDTMRITTVNVAPDGSDVERNAFKSYVPYITAAIAAVIFSSCFWCAFKKFREPRSLVPTVSSTTWRRVGTLKEIYIYPVKSCGPVVLDEAECSFLGLRKGYLRDRFFMIIDEYTSKLVSARSYPELLTIQPTIRMSILTLQHKDMEPLQINMLNVKSNNKTLKAYLGDVHVSVLDCGWAAGEWISRLLIRTAGSYRLVYCASETGRPARDSLQKKYKPVALSDEAPYHLISQSSLEDLNSRLSGQQVNATSFRPNLVVAGADKYDEDKWGAVRVGDNVFTVTKPCYSYRMSDINTRSGLENEPSFGVRMALRSDPGGVVSVNDPVFVVDRLCYCEDGKPSNTGTTNRHSGSGPSFLDAKTSQGTEQLDRSDISEVAGSSLRASSGRGEALHSCQCPQCGLPTVKPLAF